MRKRRKRRKLRAHQCKHLGGERTCEAVRQLTPIAENELDCTMAQLALAWCLKNEHVSTVITGASRPEQVHENTEALDVAERLSPEHMARIKDILDNAPAAPTNWRNA